MAIMIRIRSRDGLERVTIENPNNATIADLKALIENQLGVPISIQALSKDQNLLLARTLDERIRFSDMANPQALVSWLGVSHGSVVFLGYEGEGERFVAGPEVAPAGSFGRKMTVDDLIKRDCANESLSFAAKGGGFRYEEDLVEAIAVGLGKLKIGAKF
ncbi:hypothetical protein Syun_028994 [Stephania yunnanensis]|uniref:Ubiquitin-like domain-containing protein n=1 Tax=Stephania yunnanensis TaxID=152371 RepID=A0AAP0E751_9MAGN